MATYAEYLKSQGASEADIAVLDTPLARRAYERLEESIVRLDGEAKKAKEGAAAYEERVNKWYEDHDKEFKAVEGKLVAEAAARAKAEAALRTAHERGMLDVAKDLGYDFSNPATPPPNSNAPAPIDTSKFVTQETLLQVAEREGDAIAIASDIAAEHAYLFGSPLRSFRELRREAVSRKLPVQQVWEEKFKVADARAARIAADEKAKEETLRKKITEEVRSQFASEYGNPNTRPPEASRSPFASRPAANREKQPWDTGLEGESGSNDRVRRATQTFLKSQTTN
jgi:hypothetical protein